MSTKTTTKPDTTTVTVRKVGTPKETAVATTTKAPARRRKAAPKAAPAKAKATPKASAPKVKKSDLNPWDRDWSYLAEKDPTDLHADMAKFLTELTGVEMDLKTVQIVSVMRHVYQASPANKQRAEYRGLDETTVSKRSEHMIQAHLEAKEIRALVQAQEQAKADARKAKAAATRAARKAAK